MKFTSFVRERFLPFIALLFLIIFVGCGGGGGGGSADGSSDDSVPDTTTVTDIDGNVYNTVTIGTQVWMKENLNVTKYRNGDAIGTTTPATLDTSGETSSKYQWAYNGDNNNVATYGRLYTWNAAIDNRGLCPTGWHIPSKVEWDTLTGYLGGFDVAGGHLKEVGTTHWQSPNTGADNSSGFTALPGGYRGFYGEFASMGGVAYIWTSTENGAEYANGYNITSADDDGYTYPSFGKQHGLSVRCVRD